MSPQAWRYIKGQDNETLFFMIQLLLRTYKMAKKYNYKDYIEWLIPLQKASIHNVGHLWRKNFKFSIWEVVRYISQNWYYNMLCTAISQPLNLFCKVFARINETLGRLQNFHMMSFAFFFEKNIQKTNIVFFPPVSLWHKFPWYFSSPLMEDRTF